MNPVETGTANGSSTAGGVASFTAGEAASSGGGEAASGGGATNNVDRETTSSGAGTVRTRTASTAGVTAPANAATNNANRETPFSDTGTVRTRTASTGVTAPANAPTNDADIQTPSSDTGTVRTRTASTAGVVGSFSTNNGARETTFSATDSFDKTTALIASVGEGYCSGSGIKDTDSTVTREISTRNFPGQNEHMPLPRERENARAVARKSVFQCATLLAFILFIAANLFLSNTSLVRFDPYKYCYRGWPWWMLEDLRQHPEPRNVMLLGSSLMVDAVSGCDANFLNRELDQTAYHDAAYVDHVLGTKLGGKYKSFNLAIPGQMPSDAYMSLKAALNLGQHPKLVIYGVAPRDFIDSTMISPLDTETYHYLSRLVDIEPLAPALFKNPLTKLNRFLEKSVFLYGHSLDFQIATMGVSKEFLDAAVPAPYTGTPFTYWDRLKLLPDYAKTELYPTAMMVVPSEQKFNKSMFKDNTTEYIDRYKNPRAETFKTQMFFLQQLANLCKSNNTQLVLVNMPISIKNVSLLGMPKYNNYLESLRVFGSENALRVFDLNDFKKYSIEDFHDLVHLNGTGAKKFFDDLAEALAKN